MQIAADEWKVSLWDAIKQLSWFPGSYSTIVGGPSVLSMVQSLFNEWRLTPALQWIIDGYHQLTAQLASYVEPLIIPVISWVNSVLGWHLVLTPIWRPLFLLFSIGIVAAARHYWTIDDR